MTAPPPRSRPSPFAIGLVGLAFMVGGWKASTYLPEPVRRTEQARKLDEVRGMAEADLRDRLDTLAQRAQQPPYQLPGRLALLAGLLLFVSAAVRMYRHQPAEPRPEVEEAPATQESP